MNKLILSFLLTMSTLSPVALYAAHEQEFFEAECEIVPFVSDYERCQSVIRKVFPLPAEPMRIIMQYADDHPYVDPYYNSVNDGDNAELNPLDDPAEEMTYGAQRTKRALQQLGMEVLSIKDSLVSINKADLENLFEDLGFWSLRDKRFDWAPATMRPHLARLVYEGRLVRAPEKCEEKEGEFEVIGL